LVLKERGRVRVSNEVISKKDLLDLTGISYGQLYRWKRKNLIPEDWFIRKSTFTGQETFFPKEKILERIDKIQAMKENLSLDELANMFSPSVSNLHLTKEELVERNIVSKAVVEFYLDLLSEGPELSIQQILHLYILEKLLQSGDINLDEGKMVLQLLNDHIENLKQMNCQLLFVRKLGTSTCLLVDNAESIHFEKGTKIVIQLPIHSCLEELKTMLL
jgi:DNA-binding transcriptional MerR regulator